MAKQKRTKKEKILANERKLEHMYTFVADSKALAHQQTIGTNPNKINKQTDAENMTAFFPYDQTLLYKDLVKTIVISCILIASLLGISLYIQ